MMYLAAVLWKKTPFAGVFGKNTVFNFLSHAVCFDSLGTVCVDGRECQMAGYM